MNVEQTLEKLVAIDSVSSRSNREIISYASARAEACRMSIRFFPYTDEYGVEKANMLAVTPHTASSDEPIGLALVGHTDTVPYDPSWADATRLTARDGKLYGRGACDTKGFIAAALAAVEQVDSARLRRPLALVLTADEEVGCLGAKHLADARAFSALYSIVGEPTSLRPIRAGKGYCLAEVSVGGREGHSAYPGLGASAIFRAARLIGRIEEIAHRLNSSHHPAFDPPFTTLNLGIIEGGCAKNIIPGRCRFTLEWRPIPGQPSSHVIDLIQAEIEELRLREADFVCEINILRADEGVEMPMDSPLVRLLEEASGRGAGTVSFGTEAGQMVRLGAEAVVFGPGDIREAHRSGEFVPISELYGCVEVLRHAINRFCL